ncbi:avidin/streptavidin family protein [Amycolatopsis sp. CA-230715]|uniref:avidin/streptavidin family protein n=1 Tax=Amycolatopsis sp. CA-230715 TaxID=2745196 RepID=UPI001C033DC3|nr:avidin/streptavidin family protein [Amycolatopsis sp. CA-230715]QWF81387.1 hypothetical protein HUW46_04818 [Amycolatopsis sp. CA-230715]
MTARETWTGEWRNQYGSALRIADDSGGRLTGTFRTALSDSGFAGFEAEITGIHTGNCVHFAFARTGQAGDKIASFTGLLRDGRMETLWHVVSDAAAEPDGLRKLPWAHAAMTSADTFERVTT